MCSAGECVATNLTLTSVDGGWSVWADSSEEICGGMGCTSCTLDKQVSMKVQVCLFISSKELTIAIVMYILMQTRRCDNPLSNNGGQQCVGMSARGIMCATCPGIASTSIPAYQQQQCSDRYPGSSPGGQTTECTFACEISGIFQGEIRREILSHEQFWTKFHRRLCCKTNVQLISALTIRQLLKLEFFSFLNIFENSKMRRGCGFFIYVTLICHIINPRIIVYNTRQKLLFHFQSSLTQYVGLFQAVCGYRVGTCVTQLADVWMANASSHSALIPRKTQDWTCIFGYSNHYILFSYYVSSEVECPSVDGCDFGNWAAWSSCPSSCPPDTQRTRTRAIQSSG